MLKNFYIKIPVSDVQFLESIQKTPLDAFNVGFEEYRLRPQSFNSILIEYEKRGEIYPKDTAFLKIRVPIQENESYWVGKKLLIRKRTATQICIKRGIEVLKDKYDKYYELL